MHIEAINAFRDNYIWLLAEGGRAVVVDPGDAAPVIAALARHRLPLDAILITHHHPDHCGGIAELLTACVRPDGGAIPVYGPAAEKIAGVNQALADGDSVRILGTDWDVLGVPGHTKGHIAYYAPSLGVLFCGDTLFAGGCGRLFEGTAAQLYSSLQRLAALPAETAVYCAHEYTLANLRFATAVEPGNAALASRVAQCTALRADNQATVPSTIGLECATNPFLRCSEAIVVASARAHEPATGAQPVDVFTALRRWKDGFS